MSSSKNKFVKNYAQISIDIDLVIFLDILFDEIAR